MSCISFLNTCPSQGDSESALLGKILQVLNEGGGGSGAGVTSISVNGGPAQTGAVSLTIPAGGVTSVNGDPGPAVLLDTDDIPEGAVNFYYTEARFNASFAGKTTTDLAEGANLYFTEARVRATVLTGFASALGTITAADSVLSAFGKCEGRLAALEAGTAGPFVLRAGDTMTGALGIGVAPSGLLHVGTNTTALGLTIFEQASADADPYDLYFRKARGTMAAPTVITAGDCLGSIAFYGYSGAGGYIPGATIRSDSRSVIASTRVPGNLVFSVSTNATPSVITDRARVDIAGMTVGNLSATNAATFLHVVGDASGDGVATLEQGSASTDGFDLNFRKTRGTAGSPSTISSGDQLGTISFAGFDSFTYTAGAQIQAVSSGTIGAIRIPASLIFKTATDVGGSLLTTALTIDNAQTCTFAKAVVISTLGLTITSGKFQLPVVTLVDGANIPTDVALGNQFRVTLGGNRTLDKPTNLYDGARLVYEFIQDGTGNRTLALNAAFTFGTDITGVTLSTAANAHDLMTCIYNLAADKLYVIGFVRGY